MLEEIKSLFPCDIQVTQEIIDIANTHDIWNCIGALTIKSILSKEQKKYFNGWGVTDGEFDTIETVQQGTNSKDRVPVYASINGTSVSMMDLKSPILVHFDIIQPRHYSAF